ncbi:MAG: hypothetical protein JJU06_13180 [Ectothiorhodospiraceae bacterium]|nr:hypothetical protein [Ectothiorhodospiraceae bacterium]
MKITATHGDGSVTELERLDVQDGDLIKVSGDTSPEALQRLVEHVKPKRVLFLVGDDIHVLTEEERLRVARHLISREGAG